MSEPSSVGSGENLPLRGLRGLVLGVADEQSIAWGCLRLAHEQGARLVASCLNDKVYRRVEPLTTPLGIDLLSCDIEKPDELTRLLRHVEEKLGGLDFAIHSIAWAPSADLKGRVVDSSCAGFCKAMAISCHSFAAVAKRCEPLMREQGGALIAMSYLGGEKVVPNYGIMGPVKAALESLSRYLAVELGRQSIRVNVVSPGPIPTRAASGITDFDELLERAAQRSPLGRRVTLREIAQLTLFLCSPAASGITGQTLYVDAGAQAVAQ